MTASLHIVAKLPTVSRMSKVDYRNKVLTNLLRFKNTNNHTNTNTTTINIITTTTTNNTNNRSQSQVDSCIILCVFDRFLYVYIFCLWI